MSRVKLFIIAIFGVLALSAVTSSIASANWMVNGSDLNGTAALATKAVVDSETLTLKTAQLEIICEGLEGVNPVISSTTGMGDATSLVFTGCKGNSVCPLAISQSKTVRTLPVLVDVTLDEPNIKAIKGSFLSTNTSKLFATVKFEGSECAAKGVVEPIKGFQPFLAPTGREEQILQLITPLNEGTLTLGSATATLEGSILVGLASGLPFSFL